MEDSIKRFPELQDQVARTVKNMEVLGYLNGLLEEGSIGFEIVDGFTLYMLDECSKLSERMELEGIVGSGFSEGVKDMIDNLVNQRYEEV